MLIFLLTCLSLFLASFCLPYQSFCSDGFGLLIPLVRPILGLIMIYCTFNYISGYRARRSAEEADRIEKEERERREKELVRNEQKCLGFSPTAQLKKMEFEPRPKNLRKMLFRRARRTNRFGIDCCLVHVRRKGWRFWFSEADCGPLVDISMTGLQVTLFNDYKVGEEVKLEVQVPAFKGELLFEGIIQWIRQEKDGESKIGISFRNMNDYTIHHLKALNKHAFLRSAALLINERLRTKPAVKKIPMDF